MKHLFFICADGLPAPEDLAAIQRELPGWVEEMDGRGRAAARSGAGSAEHRFLHERIVAAGGGDTAEGQLAGVDPGRERAHDLVGGRRHRTDCQFGTSDQRYRVPVLTP